MQTGKILGVDCPVCILKVFIRLRGSGFTRFLIFSKFLMLVRGGSGGVVCVVGVSAHNLCALLPIRGYRSWRGRAYLSSSGCLCLRRLRGLRKLRGAQQ